MSSSDHRSKADPIEKLHDYNILCQLPRLCRAGFSKSGRRAMEGSFACKYGAIDRIVIGVAIVGK